MASGQRREEEQRETSRVHEKERKGEERWLWNKHTNQAGVEMYVERRVCRY